MDQITERFSQIYPVLQEILIKHQDQLQAIKNEQQELQHELQQKFAKIKISKISYLCQSFKINLNSFTLPIYCLINL